MIFEDKITITNLEEKVEHLETVIDQLLLDISLMEKTIKDLSDVLKIYASGMHIQIDGKKGFCAGRFIESGGHQTTHQFMTMQDEMVMVEDGSFAKKALEEV